jgi:LysM repeat protein/uncharacterized protein YvpB
MQQSDQRSPAGAEAGRSAPLQIAAVGASYAFDPGADGLAAIYAARVLERGLDPRALCADIRADRLGVPDRAAARRARLARSRVTRFGRGTAPQIAAASAGPSPRPRETRPEHARRPAPRRISRLAPVSIPRKLAVAGLALLLLLPLGVIAAGAQESPAQARYIVQPGDTLEGVAAEFGVDPAAILAASAVQNPPYLTPDEIIVVPDPGESPEAAAWNAQQRQGSSPFVAGVHDVAAGETLADIAWAYGIDPWALAMFNGLPDLDTLASGQRLRIPLTDRVVSEEPVSAAEGAVATEVWAPAEESVAGEAWSEESVGAAEAAWQEPAGGPVFAADVPAYMQAYSLSCEYAAAYIATAGLGWGVPEDAFAARIGPSANPHWGYRGDIFGAWGGTEDYGVYPEALVPTLNEFGYVGDVFYGGDANSLIARIDAGMPVLTWLGYFGDTAWLQEDDGAYLLAPGMHVVTVYGYDDWGVYVSNPGRGIYDHYAWGDFLAMWNVLDGMALAVAPM